MAALPLLRTLTTKLCNSRKAPSLTGDHHSSDMSRYKPSRKINKRHHCSVMSHSESMLTGMHSCGQYLLVADLSMREQPANAFRRGPFPRSPSMSTIEEESAEASDTLSQVFQTDKPTAYEQAREYQRALIEAMPNSIANGFTRASVLLPADAHTQAGKFSMPG